VVVGAKGMRDLELGNALVEGFTRGVTVEGKVQALEDLLNYSLNTSKGYVNVPVYQVTANDKQYGAGKNSTDGGYFVIKEVRVKETMRDFTGKTTRASVDISFIQVPPYQVDGGRDQARNETQKAAKQSLLQAISKQLEKLEQLPFIPTEKRFTPLWNVKIIRVHFYLDTLLQKRKQLQNLLDFNTLTIVLGMLVGVR
jgi:hypothetical protein